MRSVRIVVRQLAGSVPSLVAASLLGSTACDFGTETSAVIDTGGSTSGGVGGGAGSGTAGTLVLDAGGLYQQVPPGCEGYTIELPDPGLPAEPGQICAISTEPVPDGAAARVTLSATESELNVSALGKLTIAPTLVDFIEGPPVLQLVRSSDPKLLDATLSELTPDEQGGYTFTVTWPTGSMLEANDETRLVFRTGFEMGCESGLRLVQAETAVHLCGGYLSSAGPTVPSTWASSGDSCMVCRVIAELAASPIIPEHAASGLPLGQAMRARVVELARVGQSVVLFAENDGGEATSYEWHASAGKLEQVAPDVVIWHLPEESTTRSLQVAILSDEGAAVVSYAFEGGMH